jgi:hypothetical protein
VCEQISDSILDKFFDQWIYNGIGIPEISYKTITKLERNGKHRTDIFLNQEQTVYEEYNFSLDVRIITDSLGSAIDSTYKISKRNEILTIETKKNPIKIVLDPNSWFLSTIWEDTNQ